MVETRRCDLIVIGGGPGGYVAALRAARCGLATVLVERDRVGGVCLNWGCIPTKALVRSAQIYRAVQNARRFGLVAEKAGADYAAVQRRSRQSADRLVQGIEQLIARTGVTLVTGTARLLGRENGGIRVAVSVPHGGGAREEIYLAKHVVIATGGRPRELRHVPFDGRRVITSKDALALTAVPPRLLIAGGGVIGLEFADIFAAFGSKITLVEIGPRILPFEDAEVSAALHAALAKRGVRIRASMVVVAAEARDDGLHARLAPAPGTEPGASPAGEEIVVDQLLVAIGIAANVEDIGLETVAILPQHGFIPVDSHLRTQASAIYAIGDVIGPPLLAHLASAEGIYAVEHAAGRLLPEMDRHWVPAVVFTHPQVATVGLSEEAAVKAGLRPRVGRFDFGSSGKALVDSEMTGFIKVLLDATGERLLGAQVVGSEAGELIAELTLIGQAGIDTATVLRTMHAHPTFSESIPEAFRAALGEPLHGC